MAANEMIETVEKKAVDSVVPSDEISAAWAKVIVQVATDAARDPLRYVAETVVPNGGE
jgi:hypothetical protein